MKEQASRAAIVILGLVVLALGPEAQADQSSAGTTNGSAGRPVAPPPANATAGPVIPPDYVIGADDVLTIFFWREKELSADVTVRPDGRISLPLINDIETQGLTPEQLRLRLTEAAEKLIDRPNVTVMVKQINSRKVFITGQVAKPGAYPLGGPTTVMQLITLAGGVAEFADGKNIQILRGASSIRFNYEDVKRGKNLQQNIALKPGDTIVVP